MRQNFTFPFDEIDVSSVKPGEETPPGDIHGRLAFVQVGLWELRRRWLTGEVNDLDSLLANLDEDVERLARALAEETPELTAAT
jgi:hypothetical protein